MTRDSKPPSASAWRRPVLDHDLLFTFPFRVKLKKSEDLAKKTSVLIKQEGWQHWLQSGLDNPDGTELYEAYDASRDFFVEIRRVLFPELNISLPDELKFFTQEPNDLAKSKSVERLSARISKRIGDLDKGDKGGFGKAMLRLRHSGGIVGREIQVQIKDKTYNICIEYIDVCLFPDANAVLVIRLRGLRHANGTNLTSYEAGLAVRSLKLIEYRVRKRVSAPEFKDGNKSFSWADLLGPLIEPWAGSFAKIDAESAAEEFRVVLTPTENRATFARRVLGLVATLHQNSECGHYGATWT